MTVQHTTLSLESPPSFGPPPGPWQDVPPAKWQDWRWQLSHRLNTVEEFARVIDLTNDEIVGLSAPNRFRVDVTPYFASLMDPNDPQCPVRLQIMPTAAELTPFQAEMSDSLNEDSAFAGTRLGPSLSGSGVDARDHPVRQLLPLLHA